MTATPAARTAQRAGNLAAGAPDRQIAQRARQLQDQRLFARLHAGDANARDALIERFLPLAQSIARRYERPSEPLDDLIQVASLALVKAIDRFDPSRGTAFSSYAVPTIAGELKRYFRDRTWTVRPPRALQELTLRVEHAITRLTHDLDRAPTVAELAAAIDVSEEQILEALHARAGRGRLSLQAPNHDEDDQRTLQDSLGVTDEGFAAVESRELLDSLMTGVSPRSREILRLRFEQDLTQTEIGKLLGVSQMQISRLIRQSLQKMRHSAR